jgi:hypothetical protein
MTTQTLIGLADEYAGRSQLTEEAGEAARARLLDALEAQAAELEALKAQPTEHPFAWARADALDASQDFRFIKIDDFVVPLYRGTQPTEPAPSMAGELSDAEIEKRFGAFASLYDQESNEWVDMGANDYFRAGYRAALLQSPAQQAVGGLTEVLSGEQAPASPATSKTIAPQTAQPVSEPVNQVLLEAVKSFHTWAYSQRKQQSKGGHESFDYMELREQMDIADAAIEAAHGITQGGKI